MSVKLPDTSGIKVYLTFEAYFDFLALDNDTLDKEKELANNKNASAKDYKALWSAWIKFVIENKVVQAWDLTDVDGQALDPRNPEHYRKISVFDFQRIRRAISLHTRGAVEKAGE